MPSNPSEMERKLAQLEAGEITFYQLLYGRVVDGVKEGRPDGSVLLSLGGGISLLIREGAIIGLDSSVVISPIKS